MLRCFGSCLYSNIENSKGVTDIQAHASNFTFKLIVNYGVYVMLHKRSLVFPYTQFLYV